MCFVEDLIGLDPVNTSSAGIPAVFQVPGVHQKWIRTRRFVAEAPPVAELHTVIFSMQKSL